MQNSNMNIQDKDYPGRESQRRKKGAQHISICIIMRTFQYFGLDGMSVGVHFVTVLCNSCVCVQIQKFF